MSAVRKATSSTNSQWLSVNQASRVLKVSRLTVLVRALRGELEHGFVDKNPVIARASVERALGGESGR